MKMADVKVGMRLRATIGAGPFSPITVTEITERGFKYRLDADIPFIARECSYFTKEGGEHYGYNGETFYEPDEPAMTARTPVEQRIAEITARGYIVTASDMEWLVGAYRAAMAELSHRSTVTLQQQRRAEAAEAERDAARGAIEAILDYAHSQGAQGAVNGIIALARAALTPAEKG